MKKQNYTFIFNIGSKVKVKDLNISGKISGISIDSSQMITYQVSYFYNMEKKQCYFEADDLELIETEEDKSMTFKVK